MMDTAIDYRYQIRRGSPLAKAIPVINSFFRKLFQEGINEFHVDGCPEAGHSRYSAIADGIAQIDGKSLIILKSSGVERGCVLINTYGQEPSEVISDWSGNAWCQRVIPKLMDELYGRNEDYVDLRDLID